MSEAVSPREQQTRKFMAFAGTLAVVGVALNLTGDGNHDGTVSKLLAAAGLITMIWTIHRYGRLGPDPVMEFELEEPSAPVRRKKKKKKPKPEGELGS